MLSYEQFVVPLVKAVQELSVKNTEQDAILIDQTFMIESLQRENVRLFQQIAKIEKLLRALN